MLSLTIVAVMLAVLYLTFKDAHRISEGGETMADLQEEARRVMAFITDELQASGFATVDGKDYPHIFYDGNAMGDFAVHYHEPAQHRAQPGDVDFGPTSEIVFRIAAQPPDADGDNVPDAMLPGPLWTTDEISYVLVTNQKGQNELRRQINGLPDRVLSRHVERITFDSRDTDPAVGFNQVVVTIYLREVTGFGSELKVALTAVVNFRNSEEAPV